ncbi:MAG: helix-turn-helix domain-containing protein [Methylobacterium radiotolerans]
MNQSVPARLGRVHREIVSTAPGITSAELQAFFYVAENEGANQRQVCEHLELPQPSVSRALSRLNTSGHDLIECEEIGRQLAIRIAPKGKQLLARLAILLGCFCAAPASNSILSQYEIEASPDVYSHAYEACSDPRVFACDVS